MNTECEKRKVTKLTSIIAIEEYPCYANGTY